MKVIFLDVDGELTYHDYENQKTANIDIEKVKLLKEICDKTNAHVVISSSWRGTDTYVPPIYHTLCDILNMYQIPIIGKTSYIPAKCDFDKTSFTIAELESNDVHIRYGTGRAAEIQKWLSEHPDVTNFVILDDEDWNWVDYGYASHWVQPTWFGDGGLKPEHVKQAIQILTKSSKKSPSS